MHHGGIARVVIVVYGELIAAAWDGYKIVDGPGGPGRHSTPHLRTLARVSVSFRNH